MRHIPTPSDILAFVAMIACVGIVCTFLSLACVALHGAEVCFQ